jgi:hypothetical protein
VKLVFLPLLQIQRDLYARPRGIERFREYIKTMTDPETGDLALPLVAMNPMGKDHIPALIDAYIALDAESVAAGLCRGESDGCRGESLDSPADREYKIGLVVSDDLKGGWTNRWASVFSYRLPRPHSAIRLMACLNGRGWRWR